MFYVIQKGDKYFKANGFVNSSGRCDTATWTPTIGQSWATSSLEMAMIVADYHGGNPVEYA